MASITDFLKLTGNEFASVAQDGVTAGDISGWVDSGSYAFNALLSGDIYKGFPGNKIVVLGADPSTGKTFFALGAAKNFLEQNRDGIVICFESESAITKDMLVERGIDVKRFGVVPVSTVQQFKTQALRIVDNYEKQPKNERQPILFILDSLGMLSTDKEMADSAEGKDTRDMTRAQLIKAAFRVLTLKLGRAGIPMIVTNHVYEDVGGGPYASKVQAGGCLAAGTQIIMADGTLKNIDDVVVGDLVMTHEGTPGFVCATYQFDDKELYEIEFEDGSVVRCSSDHKFLIDGKWVEAKNLVDGDDCMVV